MLPICFELSWMVFMPRMASPTEVPPLPAASCAFSKTCSAFVTLALLTWEDWAMAPTLLVACWTLVFWLSAVWAMDWAVADISVMPAFICREPEAIPLEMPITSRMMPWMFSTKWLNARDNWAISSVP